MAQTQSRFVSVLATLLGAVMIAGGATKLAGEWSHFVPVGVLLALFLVIFRRNSSRLVRLLGAA